MSRFSDKVPPTFTFGSEDLLPVLDEDVSLLESLLSLEFTRDRQERLIDLDERKILELINELRLPYHESFQSYFVDIIQIVASIFQHNMRDYMFPDSVTGTPLQPYVMSHNFFPAVLGSNMGVNPFTFGLYILHDTVEEILDALCFSSQRDTYLASPGDLQERILDLESFEEERYDPFTKQDVVAWREAHQEEYSSMKDRIVDIILSEVSPGDDMLSDFWRVGLRIGLKNVTRDPGEPYRVTTDKIWNIISQDPSEYQEFMDKYRMTESQFGYFLSFIRIAVTEVKLLDGLDNTLTHLPAEQLISDCPEVAGMIDRRAKALLKRLYLIEHAKEVMLDEATGFEVSYNYEHVYRLHILLAVKAAEDASQLAVTIESKYGNEKIEDKTLIGQLGFDQDKDITYAEAFRKIRLGLEIYESDGLLDKITEVDVRDTKVDSETGRIIISDFQGTYVVKDGSGNRYIVESDGSVIPEEDFDQFTDIEPSTIQGIAEIRDGKAYVVTDDNEIRYELNNSLRFAGTMRRLNDFSERIRLETLYHGLDRPQDVIQFYKEIYALARVFERSRGIGACGNYDSELVGNTMAGLGRD